MKGRWWHLLLALSLVGNLVAWGAARWREARWRRMFPYYPGVAMLGHGKQRLLPLIEQDLPQMQALQGHYQLLDARIDLLSYDITEDTGRLAAALDSLVLNVEMQYRLAIASARQALAEGDHRERKRYEQRWRKMMCLDVELDARKR